MGDEAGHEHQIDRALADDLVGDAQRAALRVPRLRPHAAPPHRRCGASLYSPGAFLSRVRRPAAWPSRRPPRPRSGTAGGGPPRGGAGAGGGPPPPARGGGGGGRPGAPPPPSPAPPPPGG